MCGLLVHSLKEHSWKGHFLFPEMPFFLIAWRFENCSLSPIFILRECISSCHISPTPPVSWRSRAPPPASHVPSVSPGKPRRFETKLEETQLLWFFSFVNRFDKTEWEEPKNGYEKSWLPFPDLSRSCWGHGQVPSPFCFFECKIRDEDNLGV